MTEREPVGSLAEEAARLLAALQGFASEERSTDTAGTAPDGSTFEAGGAEAGASTGHSAECRWCPLCQLVRAARATSPEVREHLSQAALSLALAFKGILEDSSETARRAVPLEKIDLTEE